MKVMLLFVLFAAVANGGSDSLVQPVPPAATGPPNPMPGPDEKPSWPPVVTPVWPLQFQSNVTAWETDAENCPTACNVTGQFIYDYVNDRMRQNYNTYYTAHPRQKKRIVFYWWGTDHPVAERIPKGAIFGHFYVTLNVPVKGNICQFFDYTGMTIPKPDMWAVQANPAVKYVGREYLRDVDRPNSAADKKWGDHYDFYLDMPCDAHGNGMFNIWNNIYTQRPVMDHGPNFCTNDTNNLAETHWLDFIDGPPPNELWEDYQFEKCKEKPSEEVRLGIWDEHDPETAAILRQFTSHAMRFHHLQHAMDTWVPWETYGKRRDV